MPAYTRPTNPLLPFAWDAGALVTAPPSGLAQYGWGTPGQAKPNAANFNFLTRQAIEWLLYLDQKRNGEIVAGASSIMSGLTLGATGGLSMTLSAGVLVLNGTRLEWTAADLTASGDNTHAYGASSTTYLRTNVDKVIAYDQVALQAAPPTPPAGYVYFARVDTTPTVASAVVPGIGETVAGVLPPATATTMAMRMPSATVFGAAASSPAFAWSTDSRLFARFEANDSTNRLELKVYSDSPTPVVRTPMSVDRETGRISLGATTRSRYVNGDAGNAFVLDPANGDLQALTLDDSCVLTVLATAYDYDFECLVKQDATGGNGLTVNGVVTEGGVPIVMPTSPNAAIIIRFVKYDGNVYASYRTYGQARAALRQRKLVQGSSQVNSLQAILDEPPAGNTLLVAVVGQAKDAGLQSALAVPTTPAGSFTAAGRHTYQHSTQDYYQVSIFVKRSAVGDISVTQGISGSQAEDGGFLAVYEINFPFSGTPAVSASGTITSADEALTMTTAGAAAPGSVPAVALSAAIFDDAIPSGLSVNNDFELVDSVPLSGSGELKHMGFAFRTLYTSVVPNVTWTWGANAADAGAIVTAVRST